MLTTMHMIYSFVFASLFTTSSFIMFSRILFVFLFVSFESLHILARVLGHVCDMCKNFLEWGLEGQWRWMVMNLCNLLLQVVRVYIGSFWAQPLLVPDNRKLFEAEEQDLFLDIQSLPRNAALRKLNDLIKRARLAKVSINITKSVQPC